MNKRHVDRESARGFGKGYIYVGVGFQFVGAVLLFLFLGWQVDGWLEIRPLFTVLGALLGGAAGFYAIVRRVQRDIDQYRNEKDKRSNAQ